MNPSTEEQTSFKLFMKESQAMFATMSSNMVQLQGAMTSNMEQLQGVIIALTEKLTSTQPSATPSTTSDPVSVEMEVSEPATTATTPHTPYPAAPAPSAAAPVPSAAAPAAPTAAPSASFAPSTYSGPNGGGMVPSSAMYQPPVTVPVTRVDNTFTPSPVPRGMEGLETTYGGANFAPLTAENRGFNQPNQTSSARNQGFYPPRSQPHAMDYTCNPYEATRAFSPHEGSGEARGQTFNDEVKFIIAMAGTRVRNAFLLAVVKRMLMTRATSGTLPSRTEAGGWIQKTLHDLANPDTKLSHRNSKLKDFVKTFDRFGVDDKRKVTDELVRGMASGQVHNDNNSQRAVFAKLHLRKITEITPNTSVLADSMWTFINAHVRGYEGIDPRADLVVDLEKNLHEQFAQFAQECLNSNIPEEEAVKSFTDYLGKSHPKQWNEAMVLASYTPHSGAPIDVVLQQFHTLVTTQRQTPTPTPSPAPTPAFFGGAVGAGCFICGSRHTWRRCWYKESHRSKANAADKFCHIHGWVADHDTSNCPTRKEILERKAKGEKMPYPKKDKTKKPNNSPVNSPPPPQTPTVNPTQNPPQTPTANPPQAPTVPPQYQPIYIQPPTQQYQQPPVIMMQSPFQYPPQMTPSQNPPQTPTVPTNSPTEQTPNDSNTSGNSGNE